MVTKKKPKSTPKKVQTKTKANLKAKPKKSALRKTSVKKTTTKKKPNKRQTISNPSEKETIQKTINFIASEIRENKIQLKKLNLDLQAAIKKQQELKE